MANQFFKPNWQQINKAIADGGISGVRAELRRITKIIDAKMNQRILAQQEAAKAEKLQAIKKLPAASDLFYIGSSKDIPFGCCGHKVRDGYTYVTVEFNGKFWKCVYASVQPIAPTRDQIISHGVQVRIGNILK